MRRFATLVVAALLLIVPAADAKDVQLVSGGYTLELSPPTTMDQRSENVCVLTLGIRINMVGDLTGPLDVFVTMNNKGACEDFSARANIHGKGSFQGTLGGRQGAFDVSAVVWHDNFAVTGRLVIQHATGDLSGLHGELHIEGFVGAGGSYQGKVHFAP